MGSPSWPGSRPWSRSEPDRRPQSPVSPLRTRAIAFSMRSLEIVRYLARLDRSTSEIERTASGERRTSTRESSASASDVLALMSESSVSSAIGRRRRSVRLRLVDRSVFEGQALIVGRGRLDAERIGIEFRAVGRSGGASPATFDLLAQPDQRQLAPGHLLRQSLALLRVVDLHEFVGVGQGVFAQGHQRADLVRCIGEPEAVLEVPLVLADLVGQLADAVPVVADHAVVHRRLVEWRDVLALQVLDDRDLERRVVVDVLDEGGDGREPGDRRGAPATLTRDQLIAVRSDGTNEDRLEHAMLADRCGQLIERLLVVHQAWLLGVRVDVIDRDDPDTDTPRRRIRGEQADDRGTELPLLR